jgi:hypothetical protein
MRYGIHSSDQNIKHRGLEVYDQLIPIDTPDGELPYRNRIGELLDFYRATFKKPMLHKLKTP